MKASDSRAKDAIAMLLKSVNDPIELILMTDNNHCSALTLQDDDQDPETLDMSLIPLGEECISELIQRRDYSIYQATPLIFAICYNHFEFAKTVLNTTCVDVAAMLMYQDLFDDSALTRAVKVSLVAIIPMLFDALPSIDLKQRFAELRNNETALMLAIENGDVRSIDALFVQVPDPRRLVVMTNLNGETVMQYARSLGNLDVVSALENAFPDL